MIKANELRLENLVLARCVDDKNIYEQTKVTGIDEDEIHHESVGYTCWCSSDIEYIKPIPLTEEWLLSKGKTKHNDGWFYLSKNIRILFAEITGLVNVSMGFSESGEHIEKTWLLISFPKYVHQLQNLYFALCGKELVLNN